MCSSVYVWLDLVGTPLLPLVYLTVGLEPRSNPSAPLGADDAMNMSVPFDPPGTISRGCLAVLYCRLPDDAGACTIGLTDCRNAWTGRGDGTTSPTLRRVDLNPFPALLDTTGAGGGRLTDG